MIDGDGVGPITPEPGVRQGDPLSPYLFILCLEGLFSLLHQAESKRDIHGAQMYHGAPQITHLLFVNDCFLLCKDTEKKCSALRSILQLYETTSRQAINMQKSKIF
uniref:Reverse transcriptase domain-containing protein n=1 Tax=Cajanus cajan TaxID=3821 RepID=A0A151UB73_CAJCA|nr:hypothetical protein KK1_020778 [Cajanus cajan]